MLLTFLFRIFNRFMDLHGANGLLCQSKRHTLQTYLIVYAFCTLDEYIFVAQVG